MSGPADAQLEQLLASFLYQREADPEFDLTHWLDGQPAELRGELAGRCQELLGIHGLLAGVRPATSERPARFGPYRVERQIGRGAMAEVFLVRDERSGEERALKVMRRPSGALGRDELRFRREAQTLAKLRHPAIVTIHEVGEAEGRLYIAMDYVPGRTLRGHIADERARALARSDSSRSGDLARDALVDDIDNARAARLVAELANALHAAHQVSIIHRDLKPDNVLVDEQGRPHLLDFGLARDLAEASISGDGDLAGTPYYMSPEAARGDRAALGPTSDVFSLGVLLYELLTLRRPFVADDLSALLDAIEAAEPVPVLELNPSVPRDLAAVCHKALAPRPEQRYAQADELARELMRFVEHRAVRAGADAVGAGRGADTRGPECSPNAASGGALRGSLEAGSQGAWWAASWPALLTRRSAALLLGLAAGLGLAAALGAGWIGAQRARTRAALETLPAPGAVAGMPLPKLLDVAGAVRELAAVAQQEPAWWVPLAADDHARVQALRSALAARGRSERDAALAAADAERAGQPWPAPRGVAPGLLSAALLWPDDPDLLPLSASDAWWPSLELAAPGASGARLRLRRLDPWHLTPLGPWQDGGELPLASRALAPGPWLLVVSAGDAVWERLLEPRHSREHVTLSAAPRPPPVERLAFEASALSYGSGEQARSPYGARRLALPAFFLAPRPVSRAEYAQFVRATGYASGRSLLLGEPPSDVGASAPVTGVRFDDARAYACWRGARLPSAAEWDRAAQARSAVELGLDQADPAFIEWTASPLVERDAGGHDRVRPERHLLKRRGDDPGHPTWAHDDADELQTGFRLAFSRLP